MKAKAPAAPTPSPMQMGTAMISPYLNRHFVKTRHVVRQAEQPQSLGNSVKSSSQR